MKLLHTTSLSTLWYCNFYFSKRSPLLNPQEGITFRKPIYCFLFCNGTICFSPQGGAMHHTFKSQYRADGWYHFMRGKSTSDLTETLFMFQLKDDVNWKKGEILLSYFWKTKQKGRLRCVTVSSFWVSQNNCCLLCDLMAAPKLIDS